MARRRDINPSNAMAEEYADRQAALDRENRARQDAIGSEVAQGVGNMGALAAEAVSGAQQSYNQGKQRKMEKEAHDIRVENARADQARARAEDEYMQGEYADGKTRAQRMFDLKMQKAEEEARPKSKEMTEYQRQQLEIARQRLAKGGGVGGLTPYQQLMLQRNVQLDKDRAEAKEAALKLKQDESLDKKTLKYSESLEKTGVPKAVGQLEAVYQDLPPKGDIEGYGVIGGAVPDILTTEKGKRLRQNIATLFNIELKDRSGAAVTDQELQRLKDEFGSGSWKTEAQLRQGIAAYQKRLQEVIRNIEAGVDPEAAAEYVKRDGRDFKSWKGRQYKDAPPSGTAIAKPVYKDGDKKVINGTPHTRRNGRWFPDATTE